MATAILDRLLQQQWGKSFIMWVFIGLCAGIFALGWMVLHQSDEIRDCNRYRILEQKEFSFERERLVREQISFYQSLLQRIDAVEKKRKK